MQLHRAVSIGTSVAFVIAFVMARLGGVSLFWATALSLLACPLGVMCAWGLGNIAESLLETEETVQPTWSVPGAATWLLGSAGVGFLVGLVLVVL